MPVLEGGNEAMDKKKELISTEIYDRIYNEGYNAKIRDKNEKLRVEDRKNCERTLLLNGQYNDNVKAANLAHDKHTRVARIHMMFNTITYIVIAAALMALVIVV